jgi:RNA 3'-terminal phosphate cyclase-like protein
VSCVLQVGSTHRCFNCSIVFSPLHLLLPASVMDTQATPSPTTLVYKGAAALRQRIVMATLSGKSVRLEHIRANADEPGLRDYEVAFLKLIEQLTNGSRIEIGFTGTTLLYRPGVLVGGRHRHECPPTRGIGYYLEPVLALAPFAKEPIQLTLTGITNNDRDVSVDVARNSWLPFLSSRFFPKTDMAGLELKIVKRGAPPLGGGEVLFQCPVVRQLKSIHLIDSGLIKRIRGISYATRVQPHFANRLVEGARGVLNEYIPDVYIFTDIYKGAESGLSPGYALSLVAETTTGVLLSAEATAKPGDVPEDLGRLCALRLLSEIERGGCIDTATQALALMWSVLTAEDVSKIRVGKLSSAGIQVLRDLRDFFGVTFRLVADRTDHSVVLTCVGTGFVNLCKKVT